MATPDPSVLRARDLVRRGAYAHAGAELDALAPEARARPRVAIERSRARMRQGDVRAAVAALDEVDDAQATPGERLILALDRANLLVFRDGAFAGSLARAQSAVEAAPSGLDEAVRAEAAFLRARLLLMAGTYREVTSEVDSEALSSLPAIADRLVRAGREDEAYAARAIHAERLMAAGDGEAAAALAACAREDGRSDVAARALLAQAEHALAEGQGEDVVLAALDRAEASYAEVEHLHGPVDVRRVRGRLEVERAFGDLRVLHPVLEEYRAQDYVSAELSLLMDLSGYAHERGRLEEARAYREAIRALAERLGMGLSRHAYDLAVADLHTRNGAYREAIETCEAALAAAPPGFAVGSYETLLASAYAFVGDREAAVRHRRLGLAAYCRVGDEDTASDVAASLADDLVSLSLDDLRADRLLRRWRTRDVARGDWDAAIDKSKIAAQFAFRRYNALSPAEKDVALLDAVERHLAEAEALVPRLPPRPAAKQQGSLSQARGQYAAALGDDEGSERGWADALRVYEEAGLEMEAANSRYILGVLHLNRAHVQLQPHFGEAEQALLAALGYYDGAAMRRQAADARFMLARLYVNAAVRTPSELAVRLREAALDHLAHAEADYDALRRDYTVGSVLDAQRGKQALVEGSRRLYALALEVLTRHAPDAGAAWRWVQRSKARALGDALGTGGMPSRTLAQAPAARALIAEEHALVARLERAPAAERTERRAALEDVRRRMAEEPALEDYLELREGRALDAGDFEGMLAPEVEAGRPCVCVDWFASGERLWVAARQPGSDPKLRPVDFSPEEARAFVQEHLGPLRFRTTLRDLPEDLDALAPLVAPLADLSEPGDLLILSPTGPLHALPLHALSVGGEVLLVRNPIAYTPSLSVLRHALLRGGRGALRTAALFGDPSVDRTAARVLVEDLAGAFGVEPLTGAAVTRQAFECAAADRDLVHFQGHAVHDAASPLDSHLVLAGAERLTARDVFALPRLSASLVTLGACESAVSKIRPGDEPLGLIPGFLFAGAGAVLASLWRVREDAAALTMRRFYDALPDAPTRAHALREAALSLRSEADFSAPYYWAAFTLNGSWL